MRRAATAKSSSRKASSFERTVRAAPGQSSSPRMMVTPKYFTSTDHVGGIAAASAISSGNVGIDLKISI